MYKSLSLITLLGGMLTTEVAWAMPIEVDLSINRQQSENYEQFVQRAQILATNTIQQHFQENKSLEELRVLVIGENQGAIAPVLAVEVNRDSWNTEPNVERWQDTFPYSKDLLGFEQPQAQITKPTVPTASIPPTEPESSPETPTTPKKTVSIETIPLPSPKQIPLPNQRLQPNRIK